MRKHFLVTLIIALCVFAGCKTTQPRTDYTQGRHSVSTEEGLMTGNEYIESILNNPDFSDAEKKAIIDVINKAPAGTV